MKKYSLPLSYMYKSAAPGEIVIEKRVFEQMMLQLRAGENKPDCPEKGGILGSKVDGEITHFFYDENGIADSVSYRPDGTGLQRVIHMWKSENIRFLGVIHTHTREDALKLSRKDLQFVRTMLQLNPGLEMVMAILAKGGKMVLYKFAPDFLEWADKEMER